MEMNYPELYYRIYPKAIDSINKYLKDKPMPANITEDELSYLVDEVYEKLVYECPEIDEDPVERRSRFRSLQRQFYGRRRLARDIITIIIISELLRRFNPYIFGTEYNY
ncbi:MAG: hypothetical protein GXZ06_00235 [Tissierellia bacterium]|nr:hypothetical protein [Tissierellia bacterium]